MSAAATSVLSRRGVLRSEKLVPIVLVLIVAALVVAPLVKIVLATLSAEGIEAWQAVLASRLSPNLWWRPLANTLALGIGVAAGCILMGGFLAWLVTLTDVPGRKMLGLLATLPFMIVGKGLFATGRATLLTMLVAYLLFALDQIARELGNPFSVRNRSHLPLDDVSRGLEQGLLELLEDLESARPTGR